MKQRRRIKQYKKELNHYIEYWAESFEYYIKTEIKNNRNIKRINIEIYNEYFKDLVTLLAILRKKRLHIIRQLYKDWNIYNSDFSYLLDCIDGVYENAFDDQEVYNFSDLLRYE